MNETIAWCAGHGENTYRETGGKGVPAMAEHEFNAAVVGHALPLAEHNGFRNLVVQPLMGRDRPLKDRIAEANKAKADFYFSVHADANSNPSAYGHWGAYWHTAKDSKRFGLIWQEIADALLPNTNPSRRIFPSVPKTWSEYAVCRDTAMPAFLAEHAFMTNANDLKLLLSEDFRRLCAEVAVRALCKYFGRPFKALPAPKKTDYPSGQVVKERFRDTTVHTLFLRKGSYTVKLVEKRWATTSQLVKVHGADFGVNCAYHSAGTLLGDVVSQGKQTSHAYGKMLKWHSVGFQGENTTVGMLKPSEGYETLFQGAPLLIERGVHRYEHYREHQEVNNDIGMSRYHDPVKYRIQPQRTFFTLDKQGNFIISVADGRTDKQEMGLDLQDMAEYADRFDPAWSINGDGGDSSVLVGKGGKVLTRLRLGSERQNSHALLIFLNKEEKEKPNMEKLKLQGNSKTEIILTDDSGKEIQRYKEDSILVQNEKGETYTYLPLRKLGDAVGGRVGWNAETKESSLTIKKR